MKVELENIGRELALEYLSTNQSNRSIRKSLVSQYANDMKAGHWRLTHQGIAFDNNGILLDGQHRLMAIVESGITIKMVVTRGLPKENQLVMDDHSKRSASDAISLARKEKITADHIAIIRGAIELQSNSFSTAKKTKTELNELLDQFYPALEFVNEFITTKQKGVTSAPVWSAIALAWFYIDDISRLKIFCSMLCGTDMVIDITDKSALTLREWLLRTGVRYGSVRREAFYKSQRAISAFMKYQPLDKLYGCGKIYPWPLINPKRK